MNKLSEWMAEKIINEEQSYTKIFYISIYKMYQDDVDAILIAEGRQDLIR